MKSSRLRASADIYSAFLVNSSISIKIFLCQRITFAMYPLSDFTLYDGTPLSMSFSGSGFLLTYQLGVSQCLLENAPWILQTSKVYGSSAGALVAAAVVCGASMGGVRDDVIEFAKLARVHSFGPLHPGVNFFKWMENTIRRRLPLESHKLASGRLCISMTRVPDGKNVIVSEFQSHEDVVKALLCSCFIPMYCGVIPPSYKGVHYVDGGLTNIQPTQTQGKTLTISPFSGDMDICPQDDISPLCDFVVNGHCFKPTLSNFSRAITALYPRNWKVLSEAYVDGYQDAVDYLQQHGIIQQNHNWLLCLPSNTMPRIRDGRFPLPEENDIEEYGDERSSPKAIPQNKDSVQKLVNPPWGLNFLQQALNSNAPGWIQNVFLYDMSLFGLMGFFSLYFPIRLFTVLLIACILPFWAIFMITYRFQRWLTFAPMAVFWLWQDLKQIVFFISSFFVSTLKQNLRNRLLPALSLVPCLEVQTKYESISEVSRRSVLKVELSTSASQHRTSSVNSEDRHVCTLQFILE